MFKMKTRPQSRDMLIPEVETTRWVDHEDLVIGQNSISIGKVSRSYQDRQINTESETEEVEKSPSMNRMCLHIW